jgi:hypothetical protein
MTVFVFGNPDLEKDSLALKILPALQKEFPRIKFVVQDPNEEWDVPEELVVIDNVVGIDGVRIFEGLKEFIASPRVSLHDFDALTNLCYLQKLGKLKKIKIIGLPATMSKEKTLEATKFILRAIQL